MAKKSQVQSQNVQNKEVEDVKKEVISDEVIALKNRIYELEFQARQKDLEIKRVCAVSLLKQDPRYRSVVWLDESQAGLVGVGFRAPYNCSSSLRAFVTLLWSNQAMFDCRLIGSESLRLEPPQVPVTKNGSNEKTSWRNIVVWSDAYKAKLQHDVVVAYQRWSGR